MKKVQREKEESIVEERMKFKGREKVSRMGKRQDRERGRSRDGWRHEEKQGRTRGQTR